MDNFLKGFDFKNHSVRLTIAALVSTFVVLSWFGFLDALSQNYIDSAIVQSTVAFGVARGLNALISVLQSTEVSFQLGAGVAVSIGEALDPVNDLVEQYSSLMKMSIGSLVIQKLLIEIVSDLLFKVLITFSGLALVVSLFIQQGRYINLFAKTFVFLFFIRFILVFVVLLNGMIDRAFIQEKVEREVSTLQKLTQEVEADVGSASKLPEHERLALKEKLVLLTEQKAGFETKIEKLSAEKLNLETALDKVRKEINEYQSGLGIQRYNPLSEDKKLDEIKLSQREIENEIKAINIRIEHNQDTLISLSEEYTQISNTLEGKPNSFTESMGQKFSSLGEKVSSMTSNVDVGEIKGRIEGSISEIINVMTIFLFKTLILPLVFLFLLIKGTNLIWNIDVQELVRKESKEFVEKSRSA